MKILDFTQHEKNRSLRTRSSSHVLTKYNESNQHINRVVCWRQVVLNPHGSVSPPYILLNRNIQNIWEQK